MGSSSLPDESAIFQPIQHVPVVSGTSLGAMTVVVVALTQHWTALLDPATVAPAPLIGTLVGLAAGLYPALRASRVEPLDALRR